MKKNMASNFRALTGLSMFAAGIAKTKSNKLTKSADSENVHAHGKRGHPSEDTGDDMTSSRLGPKRPRTDETYQNVPGNADLTSPKRTLTNTGKGFPRNLAASRNPTIIKHYSRQQEGGDRTTSKDRGKCEVDDKGNNDDKSDEDDDGDELLAIYGLSKKKVKEGQDNANIDIKDISKNSELNEEEESSTSVPDKLKSIYDEMKTEGENIEVYAETIKAEQDRLDAEEEKRKAEDERKKAEEEKRIAEEERRIAEEERVKAEEERVKAEAERQKQEEEAKRAAEEMARKEREKAKELLKITHYMFKSGAKLQIKSVVLASACTLLHKFFEVYNTDMYDPYLIGATAIYLGHRIEEETVKIRDVINVCHRTLHPEQPPLDMGPEYLALRESILTCELFMLRVLNFKVTFNHPHRYMLHCLKALYNWLGPRITERVPIARTAWTILSDCYHGNVCTRHEPSEIATSIIYFATQCHGIEVPYTHDAQKHWYQVICEGITLEKIRKIIIEIIEIYDLEDPKASPMATLCPP